MNETVSRGGRPVGGYALGWVGPDAPVGPVGRKLASVASGILMFGTFGTVVGAGVSYLETRRVIPSVIVNGAAAGAALGAALGLVANVTIDTSRAPAAAAQS